MNNINQPNSVGLVKTQYYTFAEEQKLKLVSGKELGPVTIAYETYGKLNSKKSNAILILHALSGTAHAAGYNTPEDKRPGWWDAYIGPGKAFDTEKYFVISSNIIGGCNGSTGPSSINPETGKPYALSFPLVAVQDMVEAQRYLIDYLEIDKLLAVAGGSMGGMQALSWAIQYPERINSVIALATSFLVSAQGIAFNEVGRQAIMTDPNWSKGDYYGKTNPSVGLALARMIGHITYLSEVHMHEKFGRNYQIDNDDAFSFDAEYMVGSYLKYQGSKFVDRFDANSYLYITRAIDLFDLRKNQDENLLEVFENTQSDFLIASFSSDWLYPSLMSKDIVKALRASGKNVTYIDIESEKGHDSFLLESKTLEANIENFLKSEFSKVNGSNSSR